MGERFKDPTKNFVCSFFNCKASFSKSWKLEAHYCKHTGLRPFACDSCDKSFCTRYQLTRHNLSHSGKKPYQCLVDGCSEGFTSTAGLKNHVERVHQHKETHYVCDHEGCLKAFHKNNQLKSHKCEHMNQLPFECQYEGCGKKYATSKKLQKHEKVHDGYPCAEEGCTFQGRTWTEYQAHRKAEHRGNLLHLRKSCDLVFLSYNLLLYAEILQCDSCTKVFHNAWFLKKHKLHVHMGVRRVFKCTKEGCLKTYSTHFNLQNHILSFHEGKRSFICSHDGCGKAFAMEESLKRHAVVHDPQKKKMQKAKKGQKKKKKPKANVSNASELSAQLKHLSLNQSRSQNVP
ncbi:general transcription factor IIIA, b isoform X1 [Hemibagrus wyckioides]|uniref:general transcription factor IIIA, b isoform X1 n=1 Tax=Hemibagrus wyckioides TaxID=337641 RepID=UPI00266BD6A0|nr:general transcription factor IIIA, b isoform X1 [Hemibagrus wyckioides]